MKLLIAEAFELIRNGVSIKQDKASGGIPITRIETIANGSIDYNRLGYAGIDNDLYKDYYLQVGDILMSHINSEEHLGKVAIYNGSMKIIHGMNLLCLRPNKNIINPFYAFFFFKSKQFRTRIQRITKKSVNQASFNITSFEKLSISLPNLNAQNDIAQTLLQTETLIKQRKESISLLDEFLRSTFLKMFGDNTKFSKMKLTTACIFNPKKAEIVDTPKETEVSFVPMAAVSETGEVDLSEKRTLNKVWTGFTYFKEGDVLFAKITPCMENGKGAIMHGLHNQIGFGSTEFHVLRPIPNITNAEWLYHFTMQASFRREAEMKMSGSAGQKRVPSSFFETYQIHVPPIEMQNQFAKIAQNAAILKTQFQESLKELENLYGSLSQRFFRPSQEAEDKRYGDPFEVDEKTAKAQGKIFYKEWKRLRDNRIMEKNLDKALEYAIHPERIPKAVAGEKINWESSDLEHFEYAGPLKEKGFGELANEALEELLNKHPNGFSFTEFRTYLKGSKNLDNYQQTKEFVFELLEKGTLIQHFATPNYMRAAENPLFNPPGGDNLRDALIWLIPVKPAVQK